LRDLSDSEFAHLKRLLITNSGPPDRVEAATQARAKLEQFISKLEAMTAEERAANIAANKGKTDRIILSGFESQFLDKIAQLGGGLAARPGPRGERAPAGR